MTDDDRIREIYREPVKVTPAMIKQVESMMRTEKIGAYPKRLSDRTAFQRVYERWNRSVS